MTNTQQWQEAHDEGVSDCLTVLIKEMEEKGRITLGTLYALKAMADGAV